ncbi:MAG TPA: hypothetical protein PKA34_18125 [Blastocatellia bacterium]|nr:hypothetical protein [Blastocatellia bacterium]
MSKRLTDRQNLLHKFQQMTDSEVKDLLDYISLKERADSHVNLHVNLKDQKTIPNSPANDDELLSSLSGAYENRRAIQVFEWERARRKAEIRAGSFAR